MQGPQFSSAMRLIPGVVQSTTSSNSGAQKTVFFFGIGPESWGVVGRCFDVNVI